MGGARERRRVLLWTAVALASFAAACNEPHLPDGEPKAIVSAAPDLTFAESPVQIEISRPTGRTSTTVDLYEDSEAAAVLDLVRGVDHIETYGGQRVRGRGALRYDVRFDVSKAAAKTPAARRGQVERLAPESGSDVIRGAIWVDREGHIVRVLLPTPLWATTRPTFASGAEHVVTYDYFGW